MAIIEDVSGDGQDSVLILLSLLYATQALNTELWSGRTFRLKPDLFGHYYRYTYSTAVLQRHSENCFVTVHLAASWPYFSAR
ncbi:hypothetical protein TNCV_444491 [Trichonephila clavipes]|nr:hypothetical protein TNCV_444491 [Trichonephila clavipes]